MKLALPKKTAFFPLIIIVTLLGVAVYFLFIKGQLALTRYFDHDELAYLYWTNHMRMGYMPYRDFLIYSAPGFLWFLSPIFLFFQGEGVFLASRIVMLLVYVGLCVSVSLLFWEMRKSWISLLPGLFLLFLPLPSDKYIEIRPDTLAFLLMIVGMWLQIGFMNAADQRTFRWKPFFVGLFYGLSLVFLQKTLIHIVLNTAFFIGWGIMSVNHKYINTKILIRSGILFISGILLVGIGILVWLLSLGNFSIIWYSLVKLPFEANVLGKMFPVHPSLFFRPNDVVYGIGGFSLGYFMNQLFWIVGLLVCIYRLLSPFANNGKSSVWQELLIASNGIIAMMAFFYLMPMKHMQYLIPSGVFIAWFVSDGCYQFWQNNKETHFGRILLFIFFLILDVVMVVTYAKVSAPKLTWNNARELSEIKEITRTIPRNEYILDLECISLYYPQPYYITCMPIGQMASIISLPIPSLIEQLEKTDTKYIFQGRWKRTQELSLSDQEYVKREFISVGDGSLLVRKDTVDQYTNSL